MPVYNFLVITETDLLAAGGTVAANGSFASVGSSFTYDAATIPAHRLEITDNGANTTTLSSDTDPTNTDGGPNADNEGTDGEIGTLYAPDGSVLGTAGQRVAADRSAVLEGSDGSTITLYEVETFDDIDIYAFSAPLVDGVTYTTVTQLQRDQEFTYSSVEMICLAEGTRIDTRLGPMPIERLVPGTPLRTADDGFLPLRLLLHSDYDGRAVNADGKPQIVRIRQGALGNARDLLVTRQHRVFLRGHLDGAPGEYLTPAGLLAEEGDGRFRYAAGARQRSYFNLLLDRHALVHAEGALVESFYPGTTSGLCETARQALARATGRADFHFARSPYEIRRAYGPLARPALGRAALREFLKNATCDLPCPRQIVLAAA